MKAFPAPTLTLVPRHQQADSESGRLSGQVGERWTKEVGG